MKRRPPISAIEGGARSAGFFGAVKFRFHPALTFASALGVAVLIALGLWQLERREWKLALIAQTESRLKSAPISFGEALRRARAGEDMEYAPVHLAGEFDHEFEARVFGARNGEPGAFIFTPVKSGDGAIYVNRGFAPLDWREEEKPASPVRIEGLFRAAEQPTWLANLLRPDNSGTDDLYFIRDPAVLAGGGDVASVAFYIDSFDRRRGEAWPQGGLTRLDFPNRHLEYALTWFGLAGALVAVWLAFSTRR